MLKMLPPALFLLLLSACGQDASPRQERQELLPVTRLDIMRGDRQVARFQAEIARTDDEQKRGLSGRSGMARNSGMIFPFAPPRPASFWMKDTHMPLDMLFVRTDGSIDMIARDARPGDLTPISTGTPVAAVIEIPGGMAKRLGIEVNDDVRWGPCAPDADPGLSEDRLRFCP